LDERIVEDNGKTNDELYVMIHWKNPNHTHTIVSFFLCYRRVITWNLYRKSFREREEEREMNAHTRRRLSPLPGLKL